MLISELANKPVQQAVEEIYTHCVLDRKGSLPDEQHLKKVLNELAFDVVESYCDNAKEKK